MTVRVAITGMGSLSGLGQGVEPTWKALISGESGVRPIARQFMNVPAYAYEGPAAVIEKLDTSAIEAKYGARVLAHLDPFSVYASIATFEAMEQAGLLDHPALADRTAIIYGVGSGGNTTIEETYVRLFDKKASSVHPLSIPKYMVSAAASQLSLMLGVRGVAFTIASACASSGHAISEGMHMLRAGRVDVAIVGGGEAPITYGGWLSWKAVRAMSSTACRPFSIGRDGMILGEGAATLILENWAHAEARGAKILGEVIGSGSSSDAFHITQPQGEGAVKAMRAALADAGVAVETPLLISSHGTGTELNDKTEAQALRTVFGEGLKTDLVIATKSAHGHLFGGAGAIELILGVLALQHRIAPPILNYLGPDPECDVPLVLGEAKPIDYEVLLSNSFAFGGLNSVIMARRV
jgi:nodulation protein E